jgi:hypothetical protein
MKDQVFALVEALRLARSELDRCQYRTQSPAVTVDNLESILSAPSVASAIDSMAAIVESPLVPESRLSA